ncbi:MAG: shikimate kinase [Muribaculaceae bacterium]
MPTLTRPVALIGYMCCGKTTLAEALWRNYGVAYVDIDSAVEREASMTVAQIFAAEGEASFREREHRALQQVLSREPMVISCGGGLPCRDANVEALRGGGALTVWLQASRQRIVDRLMLYGATRPLVAVHDRQWIERYVAEHEPQRSRYYAAAADVVFDTTELDTQQQIDRTARLFLTQILQPLLIK